MADKIIVECPSCKVRFFVTQDLLLVANGALRCGFCQHVFNGIKNMKPNPATVKSEPPKDAIKKPVNPSLAESTESREPVNKNDIETKLANIQATDTDDYWQQVADSFSTVTKSTQEDKQTSAPSHQTVTQTKNSTSDSPKVDDDILDYLDSIDFDAILQPNEQPKKNIQQTAVQAQSAQTNDPEAILDALFHEQLNQNREPIVKNSENIQQQNSISNPIKDATQKSLDTQTDKKDPLSEKIESNSSHHDDDLTADLDALLEQPMTKVARSATNTSEEISKITAESNVHRQLKNIRASTHTKLTNQLPAESLEHPSEKKTLQHTEVDAKAALNKLRNANIKSRQSTTLEKEQSSQSLAATNNIEATTESSDSHSHHEDSRVLPDSSLTSKAHEKNSAISDENTENTVTSEQSSIIADSTKVLTEPPQEKPTPKKALTGSDKPIEFKLSTKHIPSIANVSKTPTTATESTTKATNEQSQESKQDNDSKEQPVNTAVSSNPRKGNVLPSIDKIAASSQLHQKIELVPIEIVSTTDEDHPSLHTELSAAQYADRLKLAEETGITGNTTETEKDSEALRDENLVHKLTSILKKKMKD